MYCGIEKEFGTDLLRGSMSELQRGTRAGKVQREAWEGLNRTREVDCRKGFENAHFELLGCVG